MRRKARSRTAYQMFTAITVRRNAPRTLKYPRRRSANSSAIAMGISARTQRGTTGREIDSEGAVMRHGSPRLDRVRGQFRNRPSEGKDDTAEASIRPGSGVMCFGSMILSPLNSNVKMSPYETGDIHVESEGTATSGCDFPTCGGEPGMSKGEKALARRGGPEAIGSTKGKEAGAEGSGFRLLDCHSGCGHITAWRGTDGQPA